jgi:O-antigen ligase
MLNWPIKLILIFLFIFTPIAFGSMEFWAFSIMELGILSILIFWSIQAMGYQSPIRFTTLPIVLLSLFLCLIIFQVVPLPSWIIKMISPTTYKIRHQLLMTNNPLRMIPLSFVPFVTKIEFIKWLTLSILFLFLLHSRITEERYSTIKQFIVVIFLMGVFESLYGMFEYFSGHQQILYLKGASLVTGTFINHNYFAGYLLMVIPLSMGLLFSREANQSVYYGGWRHRLSSMDGKTIIIGFGVIVMILGLLFSGSRMGITCLLLSFSLVIFFFRNPRQKEKRFSRTSILVLCLALLWAVWIGLDAVISHFFTTAEDFKMRWMIWVNTFQILKEFPLFGSGLGTFSQIFPMYRSFHIRGLVTHAENDFLQLATEVGLIGIGILLVLFFFLFLKAVSGIRSISQWESQKYIGVGGLVGILALMFHSIVERNVQVPANAFLYTFIWGIIFRMALSQNEIRKPSLSINFECRSDR